MGRRCTERSFAVGGSDMQTAIQKVFPNRKEIVRMNTPKMRQR